jgi:hypothetical protein
MRHVTEPITLHMLISYFDDKLRSQWLPGQILSLTPAALAARHAVITVSDLTLPGMTN